MDLTASSVFTSTSYSIERENVPGKRVRSFWGVCEAQKEVKWEESLLSHNRVARLAKNID